MLRSILLTSLLLISITGHAFDLADDTEDISNESDAAVAQTSDYKSRAAQEKADAQHRHDAANASLQAAVAKRQKAVDEMKAGEDEIQKLNADTARLKSEVARLEKEAAATEKTISDNKATIAKANAEIQTLQQLRIEKANKFIELVTERDKTLRDIKGMEAERQQAEADFNQAKEQEKKGREDLAKAKQDRAQKEASLASLKDRAPEGAAVSTASSTPEQPPAEAPKESKSIAQQVPAQEAASDRGPAEATSPTEMTFTHKCRVFDSPKSGSKVLEVRESGVTVSKSDEGKGWISFPLNDGRSGFVAKNCFR